MEAGEGGERKGDGERRGCWAELLRNIRRFLQVFISLP